MIPTIDLSAFRAGKDRQQLAHAVDQACAEIGFLAVVGHGVPEALIASTRAQARAFFDLPVAAKLALPLRPDGVGYSPVAGENLAASLGQAAPPDLKESLNVGARFDHNQWPADLPELRPTLEAYFSALAGLAGELLGVFALALAQPVDFFADKIDRHNSFLRVINYPAPVQAPLPGQLRAGAHSDYGTLTILLSENTPGGLQVQTRAGEWLEVHAPPNAFIINIGDLLMRWSNDRWQSTLHRVVNPPEALAARSRRQSLAFFHNPNPEAVVACLPNCSGPDRPARYAPITAGEFLRQKSQKAYGG